MESKRTFADNWMTSNSDIFELLVSDAIIENFGNIPFESILQKVKIDHEKNIYYIDDIPVLASKYNPETATHIYYVKEYDKSSPNRRSKIPTSRLSSITAKSG